MLKFLVRAAVVILVLALGLIVAVWWFVYREDDEELVGKSPAEMREMSNLPFPSDASKIHYFFHAGGLQDLAMFGKFDCPANRADEIVADFIAYNDQQIDRTVASPPRRTVTTAPFETLGSGDFRLRWWDLDEQKVCKAILLGEQSYSIQFWIEPAESDSVTVYFFQND